MTPTEGGNQNEERKDRSTFTPKDKAERRPVIKRKGGRAWSVSTAPPGRPTSGPWRKHGENDKKGDSPKRVNWKRRVGKTAVEQTMLATTNTGRFPPNTKRTGGYKNVE